MMDIIMMYMHKLCSLKCQYPKREKESGESYITAGMFIV